MDVHREQMLRGYLAMLVVEKPYRSLGTGAMCAVAAVLLLFINMCFANLTQQHVHRAVDLAGSVGAMTDLAAQAGTPAKFGFLFCLHSCIVCRCLACKLLA